MHTSPSLYQQGIPCPFQNTTFSQMYWVKIFPATYLVTPLIRDGSQVLSVSLLNLFRRTRCQSPRDFWRVRRVVLMIFIALGAWWGQKECDHWVLHHRAPQRKEKVESPLLLLNSVLITWRHMTSHDTSHDVTWHITSHDTSHDLSHDLSHDITWHITWHHMTHHNTSHDITRHITWHITTHHMTHHMTSHDTSHDISHDITWHITWHITYHMTYHMMSHDLPLVPVKFWGL